MISRGNRSQHSNVTHMVSSYPGQPRFSLGMSMATISCTNTILGKLLTSFYKNSGMPRMLTEYL